MYGRARRVYPVVVRVIGKCLLNRRDSAWYVGGAQRGDRNRAGGHVFGVRVAILIGQMARLRDWILVMTLIDYIPSIAKLLNN